MTARFSILVMVARYQSPQTGGGVALSTQVIEYDSSESAQEALAALHKAQRVPGNSGRFVIDAIPLWS